MLTLDLTSLSNTELVQIVARYCSPYGSVTVLKVSQPDDESDQGAALVKMSTVEEAENLARNLHGSQCGAKVIIRLTQQGRRISAVSKKHFFLGSSTAYKSATTNAVH
jgi:hypothetical protein